MRGGACVDCGKMECECALLDLVAIELCALETKNATKKRMYQRIARVLSAELNEVYKGAHFARLTELRDKMRIAGKIIR